jgi:glycosyltransferase involved in cell wall biosynthesis
MTAEQKLITVVVPVWNLPAQLADCLANLREQDEPHHVLVVNNASDVPLEVPDAIEELVLETRVDIGQARNAGLACVRTRYLFFMDADDVLLPGALRHLRKRLESQPDAVAAVGKSFDWNPVTDARKPTPFPRQYVYRFAPHRRLHALLNTMRYSSASIGALIRTEVAQGIPPFPPINYGEDWVYSVPMLFRGRFIFDDHPSKLYRIDPAPEHVSLGSNKKNLAPAYHGAIKEIRRVIRTDPGTHFWAKASYPIIVVGQYWLMLTKLYRARKRRSV